MFFGLLAGCPGFCTGAGCDENFPNTLLSIQKSAEWIQGEVDPTLIGLNLKGNSTMGQDWAMDTTEDGLIIGTPESDEVHFAPLVNFPQSGTLSPGLAGGIASEEDGDRFGAALARADDLTGSGQRSLLVGAPDKEGGGGRIGAGAVYFFPDLGSGSQEEHTANEAFVRILGDEAGDHFGKAIEACGDMDGDGLGEILVAAPDHSSQGDRAGRVYLLQSSLIPELPAQILAASIPAQITSSESGAQLGRAMNCSADLTGDGVPDLLLAAPFEDSGDRDGAGAVHLIPSESALAGGDLDDLVLWSLRGETAQAYFGTSLSVGDVDGDGLADLLVGSPGASNGDGEALLYTAKALSEPQLTPNLRITSELSGARLGMAVGLGNEASDSLPSVFVGAPRANPQGRNATFYSGVLYGYSPQALGDLSALSISTASSDFSWHTPEGYRRTGSELLLRDLDGDQNHDLILILGDD